MEKILRQSKVDVAESLELKFEGQSKVDVVDRWMDEEGFNVG